MFQWIRSWWMGRAMRVYTISFNNGDAAVNHAAEDLMVDTVWISLLVGRHIVAVVHADTVESIFSEPLSR